MGEFLGAEQSSEQADGMQKQAAKEPKSICHDARTTHHERDYQAIEMVLLPAIWKLLSIEVIIIEVPNGVEVFSILTPHAVQKMSLRFHLYPEMDILFGEDLPRRHPVRVGETGYRRWIQVEWFSAQ